MQYAATRSTAVGLLCAALIAGAPGCTGDPAADGGSDSSATAGDDAVDCAQGSWVCTLPDASTAQMTISGMSVSGAIMQMGASATVESTFTFDGTTVSIVDTGGTAGCAADQTGTYTVACTADALTFDQVSDDCNGRAMFLGCSWVRP